MRAEAGIGISDQIRIEVGAQVGDIVCRSNIVSVGINRVRGISFELVIGGLAVWLGHCYVAG